MPRAPKHCGATGCDNRVTGRTYCDTHTQPWKGSTRGPATATAQWRKLRAVILDRDDYRCYLCGQPGADTVDHIIPVSQGGTDNPNNLAAVHDTTPPHCHRHKTATTDRKPAGHKR